MKRLPLLLAFCAGLAAADGATMAEAVWTKAGPCDLRRSVEAVGNLRSRKTTVLGSRVSGRVLEVLCEVGDRVKAGQELVRLDPAALRLMVEAREAEVVSSRARVVTSERALAAAQAELDAARAEAEDAERNRERMQALWEKPAGTEPSIPRKLFDDAVTRARSAQARLAGGEARIAEGRARLEEARSGVALAEAGLRLVRHDLAETVVRAPYDAVVTRRLVDPGTNVNAAPTTELIEVQEAGPLWLECAIPQELAGLVRAGSLLLWTPDGGIERSSPVATVFPSVDAATRSLRLRAEVEAEGLRPGSAVAVRVVIEELKGVLAVPASSLKQTSSGWAALTRQGERPVTVGFRDGGMAQILTGLKVGDEVQAR